MPLSTANFCMVRQLNYSDTAKTEPKIAVIDPSRGNTNNATTRTKHPNQQRNNPNKENNQQTKTNNRPTHHTTKREKTNTRQQNKQQATEQTEQTKSNRTKRQRHQTPRPQQLVLPHQLAQQLYLARPRMHFSH